MDLPLTQWGAGRSGYDHIQRFFRDAIPDKRANPGDDLFSAMVHAEDDDGEVFTDQQLVEHMNFLWFAAHDTTNLAMTMMSYAFAAHPEWQERAREESLALGDGPLTADDLPKLEAIDLVMKEAMRLWPPVPAGLRQAVVETSIDGYHIPKGTWLHVFPRGDPPHGRVLDRPGQLRPHAVRSAPRGAQGPQPLLHALRGGRPQVPRVRVRPDGGAAVFHRLLRTHRLELGRGRLRAADGLGSACPSRSTGCRCAWSRGRRNRSITRREEPRCPCRSPSTTTAASDRACATPSPRPASSWVTTRWPVPSTRPATTRPRCSRLATPARRRPSPSCATGQPLD